MNKLLISIISLSLIFTVVIITYNFNKVNLENEKKNSQKFLN